MTPPTMESSSCSNIHGGVRKEAMPLRQGSNIFQSMLYLFSKELLDFP